MSAPAPGQPDQPGWFADPDAPAGDPRERWFDGDRWTDLRRQVAVPAADDASDGADAGAAPADRLTVGAGRGARAGAVAVGGVAAAVALGVGVFVALGNGSDAPTKAGTETSSSTPTPTPTAVPPPAAPSSLDIPTIDPSDFPTGFPSLDAPAQSGRPAKPVPSVFQGVPDAFPTDPSGFASLLDGALDQAPGGTS